MAPATTAALPPSNSSKKRLFDDDDDDDDGDDGHATVSKDAGTSASFTINEEYARRYEHNKKREEKQKLEEKYGKADDVDEDSESSSDDGTEDEDGYLLTEDLDARMSEALQAIKSKDPRVYNSDAKFFDPADAEKAGREAAEAAAASGKDTKDKPMYLRDYHRERYLRGDVGVDDDDKAAPPKTYQQEQDEIKKALIAEMNAIDEESGSDNDKSDKADKADKADESGDSDEDFIKPKASTRASKASAAANSVHPSRAGRIQITEVDVKTADKDPELFLSNFMAARAWVPNDEDGSGPGWEALDSDNDDETGADRAEAFEAAYNLRFEDPNKSNEVLKSYSRTVVAERSVRREEKSGRQRQREQERERQAAEKQARREERARLRKLNVEEAQEKLAKIKQAAGMAGRTLAEDEWIGLLDDAWDNDAWEEKMKKQFGADYYAEKDAEVEAELAGGSGANSDDEGHGRSTKKGKKTAKPKKPKWDDDIDIKDIIPDFEDVAVPKVDLTDSEDGGDGAGEGGADDGSDGSDGNDDDDDDDDDDGHAAKRRKTGKDRKKDRTEAKRQARRERARIEALVERNMALDDPTALASAAGPATGINREGGLGAPFRYRETSPQAFGLTARDILLAPSDAALNEFAGLKKLATFRDEERKRKDRKKLGKKARLRQWRRETFGADYEQTGPTFGFERFVDPDEDEAQGPAGGRTKAKDKKRIKGKEDGGDGGEAAASKKKRKRSGRKHKNKAKGEAE